jgi:hypothetical protein
MSGQTQPFPDPFPGQRRLARKTPCPSRAVAGSPALHIRRFRDADRETVRRICCETGFLGNPIDPIYCDRELFADLVTAPYLDHEPEWTLVAVAGDRVVGYLLGSVSTHFLLARARRNFPTVRKMLARLIGRKYARHPRSEQFVRWVLTKGYRELARHPENAAHLHFNLEHAYRGGALGEALWRTFIGMLVAAGAHRVYGQFYSYPGRRPERTYRRYGLEVYDRRPTAVFQPEIVLPVHNVCVHRLLSAERTH